MFRLSGYESRHPKKTTRISRAYVSSLPVCEQMCKQIRGFKGSSLSAFGFENQRNFGATV
jgi:hypothetical protein